MPGAGGELFRSAGDAVQCVPGAALPNLGPAQRDPGLIDGLAGVGDLFLELPEPIDLGLFLVGGQQERLLRVVRRLLRRVDPVLLGLLRLRLGLRLAFLFGRRCPVSLFVSFLF